MSESPAVEAPPIDVRDLPDFRAVFDAAPRPLLLIAANPPRYTMLAVNAAHARAFRSTSQALQGWGVLEVFPKDAGPDVDAFVETIRHSFETVIATGGAHQMPVRTFPVTTASGAPERRYWSATNAPIVDGAGRVTHILSAIQDVTGEALEQQNEQMRQLLMREVDHRARNALTIVQTFVRLTTAPDLPTFRDILDGRVASLARAQTSLVARSWEGAELRDVLEGELSALAATGRRVLEGPPLMLKADHVQTVTMAVHELATNASKYGALSTDAGLVEVTWSLADDWLELTWRETGGPPVRPPERSGFGSRLIAQLGRQFQGAVDFDWRAEGLIATIGLRLDFAAPTPLDAEPI